MLPARLIWLLRVTEGTLLPHKYHNRNPGQPLNYVGICGENRNIKNIIAITFPYNMIYPILTTNLYTWDSNYRHMELNSCDFKLF